MSRRNRTDPHEGADGQDPTLSTHLGSSGYSRGSTVSAALIALTLPYLGVLLSTAVCFAGTQGPVWFRQG